MSNVVFILGAGASKEAGAPLMAEFLGEAQAIRNRQEVGDATADFDLVFRGIEALKPALAKGTLDLRNIESVFAAFELARLFGGLGSLTREDVSRLSTAIRRVITVTLERSIRLTPDKGTMPPPSSYLGFADLLADLQTMEPGGVSVITFNYDVALDYACRYVGLEIDYRLDSGPQGTPLKLIKLHGSLNWVRCPGCKEVVTWDVGSAIRGLDIGQWARRGAQLDIVSRPPEFRHCNQWVQDDCMIVPPTWNKTQYHQEIANVWKAAAAELALAENIFVAGYSLPPTDEFFRYLFALGTIGEAWIRRVWVFNPDTSREVEERFSRLLGPMARSGPFRFFQTTFGNMMGHLRGMLPVHARRV